MFTHWPVGGLGQGEGALAATNLYIQEASFVKETIDDAIELFVELAAAGFAKESLAILDNSPSSKYLEPMLVGLRLYLGDDVKTAVEILEVAKDVADRIRERKEILYQTANFDNIC